MHNAMNTKGEDGTDAVIAPFGAPIGRICIEKCCFVDLKGRK